MSHLRWKNVIFLLQQTFFFLYVFLMDTFKVTEYNSIYKVFTVFLIVRIPHSTIIIHFGQGEKAILYPSRLAAWSPGSML